jgi:hypothetical protein
MHWQSVPLTEPVRRVHAHIPPPAAITTRGREPATVPSSRTHAVAECAESASHTRYAIPGGSAGGGKGDASATAGSRRLDVRAVSKTGADDEREAAPESEVAPGRARPFASDPHAAQVSASSIWTALRVIGR